MDTVFDVYKTLSPQITLQDIIEFEKQYKDSEEEKQDLKRLYLLHKGDMDRVMESALCCSHDDEPRVRDILQRALDAKEVPAYRAFTHESAKKKSTRRRKVSGLSFTWISPALSGCHVNVARLCRPGGERAARGRGAPKRDGAEYRG